MLTILKNKITTELLEFEMPDGFIIKIDSITKDIGMQFRNAEDTIHLAVYDDVDESRFSYIGSCKDIFFAENEAYGE